jgi:hypothetical protein
MRHPSEYTTTPFGGLHIMQVDAGTVITDERTGERITVDDETAAKKGSVVYCTAKIYEAIKARCAAPVKNGDTGEGGGPCPL